MKRYTLTGAQAFEHRPEHPERTAYRHGGGLDFDVYFQVWPNSASMRKTIELQEKRAQDFRDWRACKVPKEAANTQTKGL